MTVSASMIKELRERTGAGIMDCKKALTEVDGDMRLAIEELGRKGAAAARKKAGRIAAEGIIVSAQDDGARVLVEINCETDFVAKDESFKSFANDVAGTVLRNSVSDAEELADTQMEGGETVEAARRALITKIGENISIRRFEKVDCEGGVVSCYLHGNRIGVLIRLERGDDALGRDIAMHVAASRPLCIREDDMDGAAPQQGEEVLFLLGQPFIKNTDRTVGELLEDADASVSRMVRFEVGEGLEKRSDDFVAEVMAQAGS